MSRKNQERELKSTVLELPHLYQVLVWEQLNKEFKTKEATFDKAIANLDQESFDLFYKDFMGHYKGAKKV